jgi:hypothetical protein
VWHTLSLRARINTMNLRVVPLWVVLLVLNGLVAMSCTRKPSAAEVVTFGQAPRFLTDEVATRCASNLLQKVYPNETWLPLTYTQTKAPDGSPDEYLLRNAVDSNSGTVHFVAVSNRLDKVVAVILHSNSVRCEIWRSK